jgi:hypothetical protein
MASWSYTASMQDLMIFQAFGLENGGTLEKARQMAAHASTRTTQLYDRREDRVTLDEVVKINIRG